VSGRSSTALLLGDQRSQAIATDCPLEDDRNRTLWVTPGRVRGVDGVDGVAHRHPLPLDA
jgi:hypothetical protein